MATLSESEFQVASHVEAATLTPKSTQGIFDLPCGYLTPEGELFTEVKVREIIGSDEDMLGARNISGAKKMTQLIANCVERIGPVSEKDAMLQIARKLTIGDRIFLILAIRQVTVGSEFPFEEKCPACEKKSAYVEDLSELKLKKMIDPKKRIYDVTLPTGKQARFHVMTGKDEERLSQAEATDAVSAAITVRLDLLDGQPPAIEAVKQLSMAERNCLRDEFDRVEGGVETGVELACPRCGEEFRTDLPIGSSGFFSPSRARKTFKSSTSSF